MKKYGILLSAAEHKALKQLAAATGGTMQDLARGAVREIIANGAGNSQLPTIAPASQNIGSVVARLDRIAADLAEIKSEVIRGSSPAPAPESDLHRCEEVISSARKQGREVAEELAARRGNPRAARKAAG